MCSHTLSRLTVFILLYNRIGIDLSGQTNLKLLLYKFRKIGPLENRLPEFLIKGICLTNFRSDQFPSTRINSLVPTNRRLSNIIASKSNVQKPTKTLHTALPRN